MQSIFGNDDNIAGFLLDQQVTASEEDENDEGFYPMKEYHKIQTVFKRDPANRNKTLLEGDFSLPEFKYLNNNQWVFTEKVDGTNIRIQIVDKNIVFGGKTDNAQIPAFLVQKLSERFCTVEQKQKLIEAFPDGGCLYGEGYGLKIQKVGSLYIPNGVDFVLFDVKVGDWWLERGSVEKVGSSLDVPVVPIIGRGTLNDMVNLARKGFQSQWGEFSAEGIVARPEVELKTRSGHRIITKIKHKDFLTTQQERNHAKRASE